MDNDQETMTSAVRKPVASVDIYDTIELKALIEAANGSPMEWGGNQEEAKRLATLETMNSGLTGPRRTILTGDQNLIEQLNILKRRSPSFGGVVDLFCREARASIQTKAPMRFTPILLVGPPGIGKTHTARQLARALDVPFASISMNLCDDVGEIVGHSLSWRAARQGIVSRTLANEQLASPLIMVDEIEKSMRWGQHERPTDIWLSLFERENAMAFMDAFLGLRMRADWIIWVCTANSLDELPAPLLDRMLVVPVQAPDAHERRAVAENIFAAFLGERPGLQAPLEEAALALLAQHTPRTMTKLLLLAAGYAAERGSSRLVHADMEKARRFWRHRKPHAALASSETPFRDNNGCRRCEATKLMSPKRIKPSNG